MRHKVASDVELTLGALALRQSRLRRALFDENQNLIWSKFSSYRACGGAGLGASCTFLKIITELLRN